MPAYQAEPWIGATLETVLAQTCPPDEVVVVDDGSTDRTAKIAGGFGDPVRVVRQSNGGPSAAYNRAFRESNGEFVAMCPADDLWEPDKLELQGKALSEASRGRRRLRRSPLLRPGRARLRRPGEVGNPRRDELFSRHVLVRSRARPHGGGPARPLRSAGRVPGGPRLRGLRVLDARASGGRSVLPRPARTRALAPARWQRLGAGACRCGR